MIILREVYLNRLISRMNNGMIKVITGIRRCGKSFLLFELFASYLKETGIENDQIIRIPLDDDTFSELRDPGALRTFIAGKIKEIQKPYYVLIDEAQYAISKEEMKNADIPIRLYGILNGLLNQRNVDVYITGSNSKFLSTDVMTEFRGRGDEVHIAPLTFSEFLTAYNGNKYDAWRDYSYYGGLPHILEEKSDEAKSQYL